MCGIIAYKGKEDGRQKVLDGLKKLEYRGYDSWGISGYNQGIWTYKKTGSVKTEIVGMRSNTLIAHTRWATHGRASEKNAHPHLSNNGKIAIVHNGIIENHSEVKEELMRRGYIFKSETDTEAIANLIESKKKGFLEAFKESINELKGSYAIAAMSEGKIAFARKDSPLLIGIEGEDIMIASDSTPLKGEMIVLEDGEWGVIDTRLQIFDEQGEVKKERTTIFQEENGTEKGDHEHYMIKEIYEQPEVIERAARTDTEKIRDEVFIIGCGTSYHAALAGTHYLAKKGVRATAVLASEYKKELPHIKNAIAISQSGETADLIEAVRALRKQDCKITGILNTKESTLARMSDKVYHMNAGKEIGVASTKAYTATLTILARLAGLASSRLDKDRITQWHEQAKRLTSIIDKDIFLIGRKEAYAYALEGALKIKEISYLRAEGMPAGELKHGTLALIEDGTPVIAIATQETRQELLNNIAEIKSRGGKIIGIDSEKHESYDEYIECKEQHSAIPLQLLAYELALKKGNDPDKPRNLAKSVTVK